LGKLIGDENPERLKFVSYYKNGVPKFFGELKDNISSGNIETLTFAYTILELSKCIKY